MLSTISVLPSSDSIMPRYCGWLCTTEDAVFEPSTEIAEPLTVSMGRNVALPDFEAFRYSTAFLAETLSVVTIF